MERRSIGSKLFLTAVGVLLAGLLMRDAGVGKPAPGFSLREVYGGRVDLESYRGRPVLLVFWTTSCGICRHELPVLDRMATEYQGRGLTILTIHVGEADGARQFLRENNISQLENLVDADGAVAQSYGVSGVPKMVLVGADGRVSRARTGMQTEATLRAWFDSATRS